MPEDEVIKVPLLAVKVVEPAVFKVTENDPTPLTRVAAAGIEAMPSDEAIATVPENAESISPELFFAVTVNEKGLPATVDEGTEVKKS